MSEVKRVLSELFNRVDILVFVLVMSLLAAVSSIHRNYMLRDYDLCEKAARMEVPAPSMCREYERSREAVHGKRTRS